MGLLAMLCLELAPQAAVSATAKTLAGCRATGALKAPRSRRGNLAKRSARRENGRGLDGGWSGRGMRKNEKMKKNNEL